MQESQHESHDRKPSVASAAASASSQSSGSLLDRKPTGFTIPDSASVEEHGRTFNAYREGKYLLPNDAMEQERLDLAHEMWRLILYDDLSWVPFEDEPLNVLDIGTGTGIWAIEFAQQHPASHVIGSDLSLIQPPEENVPSNCSFERDDIEDEWVFDRTFDYVHLRAMLTCFGDHTGVLKKIYDNLRPGGWVEYHEYLPDIFGKDEANQEALLASPLWQWTNRTLSGAKRFGRDMMIARQYKQLMVETGFVDVVERQVLAPNKPWPEDPRERRIGQYMQANTAEMIEAVSIKLLQADGMSLDEIHEFIPRVRECVLDPSLHLYTIMYVVYGRKPRQGEGPQSRFGSEPDAQLKTPPGNPAGSDGAVGTRPSHADDSTATSWKSIFPSWNQ
ncbi:S-adenosyl-L-methionine-dependent methyltransferase [Xylariales sp. AK1849]|nr:S-adenosyl-L-methionine-dependent methyltransferase [Xylariales sp. AK1849]